MLSSVVVFFSICTYCFLPYVHRSLFCVLIEDQVWYVVDVVLSGFVVFETGSVHVALAVLELPG